MRDWVKNVVMLTALAGWAAYIGVALYRHEPIEAILWGVPGAIYFALNPSLPRKDKNGE